MPQNRTRKVAEIKPEQTSKKQRVYNHFKRPAFVAAVLSRHAAGDSGRAIARELGVTRPTVTRILKQPGIQEKAQERAQQVLDKVQDRILADFDKSVEEARTLLQAKIPDLMRMAVTDTLEKRDRQLAHEMVKRAGVYPDKERAQTRQPDPRMTEAIAKLLPKSRNQTMIDNRVEISINTAVPKPTPPIIEAQKLSERTQQPVLKAAQSQSDDELPASTRQLLAEMKAHSRPSF